MKTYSRLSGLLAISVLAASLLFPAHVQAGVLAAASLFTDHMVLPRQASAPIWGRGTPGSSVTVRGSWGAAATSTVDAEGRWMLRLATPKAGGPYTLTFAAGKDSLRFTDVLVGEVWLCSGQSNMEMPLAGWPPADTILSSGEDIRHASLPHLRFFTVKKEFSVEPRTTCAGAWEVCSPASVPALSATAFYFGRKLQRELNIPVGLIVSSWGGTVVDAWTSGGSLSRLPGYDSTLNDVASAGEALKTFIAWNAGFRQIAVGDKPEGERWQHLQFDDSLCTSRAYPDGDWKLVTLPGEWAKSDIGDFTGVVWYRRTVTIPSAWVHRELALSLGPIDEMDVTSINGVKVGGYEHVSAWGTDRLYTVPASVVDSTVIQLAVRVINTWGRGGLYGQPGSLFLRQAGGTERVDIAGQWRCMPVAGVSENTFTVYGPASRAFYRRPTIKMAYGPNMATALYNGMIAPLVPFAVSGAIWYQGEADIFRATRYRELFSTMIENWRHDFDRPGLPFYYTQIAPFEYGNGDESAYLREAQLQALSVPHTGMAVTIDVGNPVNIHPANKRAVGERLANLALAKTYGKGSAVEGPVVTSVRQRRGAIEIRFGHATGGLVLVGGRRGNNFQIAGEDRVFRPAEVQVKGAKLIVSHPDIAQPVAVRYAWSDTPDATLFNADGLPASSFRTDNWNK